MDCVEYVLQRDRPRGAHGRRRDAIAQCQRETRPGHDFHPGAVVQHGQRHRAFEAAQVHGHAVGGAEPEPAVQRCGLGVGIETGERRHVDRVRARAAGEFGRFEACDRVDHGAACQGRVRQREVRVARLEESVHPRAGVHRVGAAAAADAVVARAADQDVGTAGADQHVVARAAAEHHRAGEGGRIHPVCTQRAVDRNALDVRQHVEHRRARLRRRRGHAAANQTDRRGGDRGLDTAALLAREGDDPRPAVDRLGHEHVALVHGLQAHQRALDVSRAGIPGQRLGGLPSEGQCESAARDRARERDGHDLARPFGQVQRGTRGVARQQGTRAGLDRGVETRAAVQAVEPVVAGQEVVARAALQDVVARAALERDVAAECRRVERVVADTADEPGLLDAADRCRFARPVRQQAIGQGQVRIALCVDRVDAQPAGDQVGPAPADQHVLAAATDQRVDVQAPVQAQVAGHDRRPGDLPGHAGGQQTQVGGREGAVERGRGERTGTAGGVEQIQPGSAGVDAGGEALVFAIEQREHVVQRREAAQVELELRPVGQRHTQVTGNVSQAEAGQHSFAAFAQDAEVGRGERIVEGGHGEVATVLLRVRQQQRVAAFQVDRDRQASRRHGVRGTLDGIDDLLNRRLRGAQIDIDRLAVGQRDAEVRAGDGAHTFALVEAGQRRRAQQSELLQVGAPHAGTTVEQREQDVGAAVERRTATRHGDSVQLGANAGHGQAQVRCQ